jgi:hypothetical protein
MKSDWEGYSFRTENWNKKVPECTKKFRNTYGPDVWLSNLLFKNETRSCYEKTLRDSFRSEKLDLNSFRSESQKIKNFFLYGTKIIQQDRIWVVYSTLNRHHNETCLLVESSCVGDLLGQRLAAAPAPAATSHHSTPVFMYEIDGTGGFHSWFVSLSERMVQCPWQAVLSPAPCTRKPLATTVFKYVFTTPFSDFWALDKCF